MKHRRTTPSNLCSLLVCAAVLAATASCGGSGGGGGTSAGGSASGDFLVTDAAVDDLLSFTADVSEIHLVRDDGTSTPNLLGGPVAVEFLGLQGIFEWLATSDLDAGTYTAASLGFQPFSYDAKASDGTPVTIAALSNELVAPFPIPLVVGAKGYRRIEIDLDLTASLSGSVAGGVLQFDPSGTSDFSSGDDGAAIDEIKGVVTSKNPGAKSLVIDAFVDDDLVLPLGPVKVLVGPGTLLVDDDGVPYGSVGAFFAALIPGATLLEVHGLLAGGGAVQATKIEVEDELGSGSEVLVKIEGKVIDLVPGSSFELLIQEIEKGAAIALPVLAAMGNPASITISFDASTLFFLNDDQLTTADMLAVGQEVKVKFKEFSFEPFPAFKVEIEDQNPQFEGTIVSVAGLPQSFVMHLKPGEPALLSGDVASSGTDVVVDIGASSLFLDTEGDPALVPAQLLTGLEVEVSGALSGPPTAPGIAAVKTKVRAGRLDDAVVASIDPASMTFDTFGGEIEDPFGAGITPGPFTIVIDGSAVFQGDATSAAGFYALYAGMQPGELLMAEVEGIGSGNPNEILAFEIEAKIED